MKITNLFLVLIFASILSCGDEANDQNANTKSPASKDTLKDISNNANISIVKVDSNFVCEIDSATDEEHEGLRRQAAADTKNLAANEDDGTKITMLVVYTTAAKNNLTNADSLINVVRRAESKTNLVFENCGIDLKVRVVALQEAVGFREVSMKKDLGSMYTSEKGKKIREWRDSLFADVVCLVRSSGGGVANMLTKHNQQTHSKYAYMTIGSHCIDESYFCFCHELGHLLGCGHEAEKGSQGMYDYSYGWHFNIPNDVPDLGRIGTMMSYIGADHRMLHFSDPTVGYEGVPIGSEKANNVETIKRTKKLVANYRVRPHS